MTTLASITSKRQLTIPASIFKDLGLKSNSKVIVETVENGFIVKPATSIIDDLAGSVPIKPNLKGVSAEEAIKKAKEKRFNG